MKQRLFVQFLVVLMVGFLSPKLDAQVPKKFVSRDMSVGLSPFSYKIPYGVAIGPTAPGSISGVGTVYVADPENNQVVAFLPGGSTLLFNSLPCPSTVTGCVINPWTLHGPTYVAVAPNGNVWISDTMNDVVVEVDPTGTVVRFAGVGPSNVVCGGGIFGGCSPRPNAGQAPGQFFGPGPLAVDKMGNLYAADGAGDISFGLGVPKANIRIQKFASNGTFLTSWGSWCNLNMPGSIVTDANGTSWFCSTFARGALALGDGQLNFVTGLAVDDSLNVYVADEGNNRVQKFTSTGLFLLKWGDISYATGDGQFNQPGGIAVGFDQSVYVVDVGNHRIQQFDGSGKFLSKGGSMGAFYKPFVGAFYRPFGIATVPPATALACFFAFDPTLSDCIHGLVVSDIQNETVQLWAARADQDNDGITDEIDTTPNAFSNDFSNTSLGMGFNTSGSIVNRGDQTFAIYAVLSPSPKDEIRIRTETFGGSRPLTLTQCGTKITLSFPAGTGADIHCSTPTVVVEEGPVGFQFIGSDGTIATATLNTGDSLSVDLSASTIRSINGTIVVNLRVGSLSRAVTLNPGQSVFVHTWLPTICRTCFPPPCKLIGSC
jgi:NHL repeat